MRTSLFQVQIAEKLRDYCDIGECFELKEEYYKKAIAAYKNIYPTIYDKPRS
ncbi:MAG: hypothetical protein WAZ77_22615 [Candidatus Nitrosopolaris sp.]|jgi:hypothetical protein